MNELYKISIYVYCIYRRGKCNFFLASKLSFSIWVCSLYGPDPISIIFSKSCCCALVLSTVCTVFIIRLQYTYAALISKLLLNFKMKLRKTELVHAYVNKVLLLILKEKVVLWAWTSTLRLNRRTRLLPYKLNLRLFFHKVKYG